MANSAAVTYMLSEYSAGAIAAAGRDRLSGARVSAPRRWFETAAMRAEGFGEERLVPSLALRLARSHGQLPVAGRARRR